HSHGSKRHRSRIGYRSSSRYSRSSNRRRRSDGRRGVSVMALIRPEGTSWVDAGLARRGLSLIGNVQQRTGLAVKNGTTTDEETLYTSNLPTGLLNADGKGLLITVWATTSSSGNNKRVKIYMPVWGTGTVVADTGLFGSAVANNAVLLLVYVFRTGAKSQDVFGYDMSSTGAGGTMYNALSL